jgi:hypothetical protein
MAETEIGTAMARNVSRDSISFTVGVTAYSGFVVSDNSLEPTAEEMTQADSNGDTIQRVFYNAGTQISVNAVVKDTAGGAPNNGYIGSIPNGTIAEIDSINYCITSSSVSESAGENARISITAVREDSMGASYDA